MATLTNPLPEKPTSVRLHYKEVLALLNMMEEFIRDSNGKPDFSQLTPIEIRAYSRLGEMKKAQEVYFQSRGLALPILQENE